MYEIEVNEIGKIINASSKNINLMFLGDTGIGKTTVIEKFCEENGIFLKTLILSQLEASETLGIPTQSERVYNGKKIQCLTSAVPEWVFDLAEHENSILFLDEFLCAQPSVQNAFLNFLTQKRVNGIDLRHVRVIAATNVGNYTFDPDKNMIARFCWFYVINTKINEYLRDKRIINNYKDTALKEGVLFEQRALQPRCHEWLTGISDEYLQLFYEGFTNRRYIRVHADNDINDVIAPYFEPVSLNAFTISDENISSMVSVLVTTFNRIRKWDKIISDFMNIDVETLNKIKEKLNKLVGQ